MPKNNRKPHTPGPWTLEYSPQSGFSVWHDPRAHGYMRRGAVIICADFRAGDEAAANAALIAAAPDLLAAIRPLAFSSPSTPPPGVGLDDWHAAVMAAREAVAKARG
jgi:hypothetical protein